MTLIAQFAVDQIPIMVGDLLITADGAGDQPGHLPLYPNINQRLDRHADFSVVRMAQKLNFLSDQLIVAWSGNYDRARLALSALELLSNDPRLTLQMIEKLLFQKHSAGQ
jgi:uncharacterized Fe-S cluster-containing radical SAM superfamily enzyme